MMCVDRAFEVTAMVGQFETEWTKITRELHPDVVIRNWGAARGYTGGTFRIDNVNRTSITVSGGDMQMPRRISKADFEKVYAVWNAYREGNYLRSKMTSLSQNTTYILGILHSVTAA
jgi:hypothetical protein